MDQNIEAFFALIRGGLWEQDVQLSHLECIDFKEILRIAEEQSVVGLVAAGIEHIIDIKVPKEDVLQFVGSALQIEQQNTALNSFIADLIRKLREEDIYTLLVKGQGIAQCYERPLWRVSGDVDLFLSNDNYEKAKKILLPYSSYNKQERHYSKELGFNMGSWFVELHSTLRTGLSSRIDTVIDDVQRDVFYGGNVRSWMNGNIHVFLPGIDNDVFFVFTHFIKHFYKGEGVCLRQVCDLCRLIWTFKGNIRLSLIEERLRRARLLTEWKALASFAVDYLGMPEKEMPLYIDGKKRKGKSVKILSAILNNNNVGRLKSAYTLARVFPLNTILYLPGILLDINCLKVKEKLMTLE